MALVALSRLTSAVVVRTLRIRLFMAIASGDGKKLVVRLA
jgi:hypothetical protein